MIVLLASTSTWPTDDESGMSDINKAYYIMHTRTGSDTAELGI